MPENPVSRLNKIRHQLIEASQSWALQKGFNVDSARQLRYEAILLNHCHYLKNIAVYRHLAGVEGCGENIDIPTIKKKLMSSDDLFKSYDQEWINSGDYRKMNGWLASLCSQPVKAESRTVHTIDEWIADLQKTGIEITYSSGTSGPFSFVPRAAKDWIHARAANVGYLSSLLIGSKVGIGLSSRLVRPAVKLFSQVYLNRLVNQIGLTKFDGY